MAKIALEEWGLYNAGVLACTWWDLESLDMEKVNEFYSSMRKKYNVEPFDDLELFCADWEEDPLNIIKEQCDIEEVAAIYKEFNALDDTDKKKLSYLMEQWGYDYSGAWRKLDDCDIYENMSMIELAEMFVDDGLFGNIPESIANYIDYEAIARDLRFDYTEYNGDIYRAS